MKLKNLLERLDYTMTGASAETEVTAVVYDSRKVTPGSLFVCIAGARSDGHAYIPDVLSKGASVIVVQEGSLLPEGISFPPETALVTVANTRRALAFISAAWFGYPAEKLPVIGITGTKGKTTTTYMVKSILDNAGYRTGLIGTIETIIGGTHIPSANTTPESYLIHQYLRGMLDAGMNAAVMEVSSQALMLDRTAGINFEIGVFTNISPDHIGPAEHSDFDDYLHCKGLLFQQCRVGVVNADDPLTGRVLKGSTCQVETYGITSPDADIRAEDIVHIHEPGYLGVRFRVAGKMDFPVELDIPGLFSVCNALTAIAICRHFRIDVPDIQRALKAAHVKGRIEMVQVSDDFTLMIDYAHNAMALDSLLKTLRDYHPGRLVCLFGCGGNRDRARRFEMGEVSGRLADLTIVTSDNPRFEEPQAIIEDIKTGLARTEGAFVEIPDRREAIAWAIHHGRPGDIIVLAGKGHEDYQEIKGKKYPMDERVIIKDILDADALR